VDALDDQHLILDDDYAFGVAAELPLARVDPARLQRAPERSSESTGGRRHQIVEGGGVLGILAGSCPVMLAHLVMGAEHHRLGRGGKVGLSNRPALADYPDPRDVLGLVHL